MKKTFSFRLSDESKNILERKAFIHGLNKTEVLECMIQEFSSSTMEEKQQQLKNRNMALNAFLGTKADAKIIKVWINGFLNGWKQFQIRKKTSLFKKSKHPQPPLAIL